MVNDSVNGFSIDTEDVFYIEKDGYHSYTFLINRYDDSESEITENLFISLQPDLSYKSFIMEYSIFDTDGLVETTLLSAIELDENYNLSSILEEMFMRDSGCTVTDINSFGDDGVEYEDINDCYAVNGSDGCGRVIVHYVGVNCPSIIAQADGDNGGGDSNDSGSNGNNGNTGTDGSGGYEQTDGDSGDYGDNTGAGGGTNGDDDPTNDNSPDDDEDCILDANGNCIGDTTVVIKKKNDRTTDQKNCDELKRISANLDVNNPNPNADGDQIKYPKQAIMDLADDINSGAETGFSLRIGNPNTYGSAAHTETAREDNKIHIKPDPLDIGYGHTHQLNVPNPDGVFITPMFSTADIHKVLLIRNQSAYNNDPVLNPIGDALYVGILTVEQKLPSASPEKFTYAIKIDDIDKFQTLQSIFDDVGDTNNDGIDEHKNFLRELKRRYKDDANDPNGTAEQYQKVLLQFMAEKDLGISLYEGTISGEGTANISLNWNKLTLGIGGNTVIKTDCNNF